MPICCEDDETNSPNEYEHLDSISCGGKAASMKSLGKSSEMSKSNLTLVDILAVNTRTNTSRPSVKRNSTITAPTTEPFSQLKSSKSAYMVSSFDASTSHRAPSPAKKPSSSSSANSKSDKKLNIDKLINENHIWLNDPARSSPNESSRRMSTTQQRLYRLFKSPHSFIMNHSNHHHHGNPGSNASQPTLDESTLSNSNYLAAANKLCNIAKNASASSSATTMINSSTNNLNSLVVNSSTNGGSSKGETSEAAMTTTTTTPSLYQRKSHSFKSLNNLNSIKFNPEDDEVKEHGDDEHHLFGHFKSMKFPFTNTITLGRRFKKNVMKLSIFNSFSLSSTHHKQQSTSNSTIHAMASQDGVKSEPAHVETPTSNAATATTTVKKSLKQQKKLKELHKMAAAAAAGRGNVPLVVEPSKQERLLKINTTTTMTTTTTTTSSKQQQQQTADTSSLIYKTL